MNEHRFRSPSVTIGTSPCNACGEPQPYRRDYTLVPHPDASGRGCLASNTTAHAAYVPRPDERTDSVTSDALVEVRNALGEKDGELHVCGPIPGKCEVCGWVHEQ